MFRRLVVGQLAEKAALADIDSGLRVESEGDASETLGDVLVLVERLAAPEVPAGVRDDERPLFVAAWRYYVALGEIAERERT